MTVTMIKKLAKAKVDSNSHLVEGRYVALTLMHTPQEELPMLNVQTTAEHIKTSSTELANNFGISAVISIIASLIASLAFGGFALFALLPAHIASALWRHPARLWQSLSKRMRSR